MALGTFPTPDGGVFMPVMFGSDSLHSVGVQLAARGVSFLSQAMVANRAIYIPFVVQKRLTVAQLYVLNGGTTFDNVDVGIYNASGTRLVSAGSTAQSGTNAMQVFNVTDTGLAAGRYYWGVVADNSTATLLISQESTYITRGFGLYQQATAFPLPATATFASLATSGVPGVGLTTSTTL